MELVLAGLVFLGVLTGVLLVAHAVVRIFRPRKSEPAVEVREIEMSS